jgi:GH24 family phage-related lysozyme (muramidase)
MRIRTISGIVLRRISRKERETMPNIPDSTFALLKLREGYKDRVYVDTRGFPTAGLGHLLTLQERRKYPVGTNVPAAVLERWTNSDTEKAYAAATAQASELGVTDQHFVDVLASVNHQLGVRWNIEFKNTWARLKAHRWEDAAYGLKRSRWARQTPVRVSDFQQAIRSLIGRY